MISLKGCYVVQNASSQTMPVFVRQTGWLSSIWSLKELQVQAGEEHQPRSVIVSGGGPEFLALFVVSTY